MKKLLIIFFLASCTSPNSNVSHNNKNMNFNDNLSFEEFNKMLIYYAKTNPYPNID
jgi:hypothetical protein